MRNAKLFAGTSHLALAERVASHLGVELAPVNLRRYTNRETTVDLGCSVREKDVYILQSGSMTTNDHLMEALIMVSAAKLASARKITVVMPYFPYSKQSKKKKRRGAISGKLVANMLTVSGADHVITMDLHASQMSGFFGVPVDNLLSEPTLARWLAENIVRGAGGSKNVVVVAKNAGGAKRVTALADRLGSGFALIHTDNAPTTRPFSRTPSTKAKRSRKTKGKRSSDVESLAISLQRASFYVSPQMAAEERPPTPDALDIDRAASPCLEISEVLNRSDDDGDSDLDDSQLLEMRTARITLVGDVRDKLVLLLDDMIDHPSSFLTAAEHLMVHCGARAVCIVAAHGLFSGSSLGEVEICPYVQNVIVTNTFPIPDELTSASSKLIQIDVAPVLAEAIRRNHNGESISYLFDRNPY
ncbi:phosphoribosyltransferase-like protein [Kickxella alabastrina]|uniref:phosphoribosyltransferase-like protein n=1 Tax=Kickxella alabastrina TaxID=61397 RepID=UPI00221FF06C|nr:phosphoribosyltransferase-like protein [Kickxella alabastrina]KAI7835084.1 phosphoribosyltransferase-like protein [Kickxella alabastrina]